MGEASKRMFLRFFSRLATVASRGKVVRESRGRSGEGVDEKSMAWGCEVLLGVLRDKMQ